ncbi:lipid-A-disaccharide synthase [Desulfurobacterium atlanticum]|uniref:Lipid-A-disaccharide synthase n=1 Tax=Desulfurobacterium atlanticum TaxID=240169 RepID=A0A238ZY38_9BACT|nr:lipid-A-disaccharide synthase [Desulfurobacterium atlanticum]SNR88356.1 lipid-A-disaccharide synthase [Desulfurobacterium atlanticum]
MKKLLIVTGELSGFNYAREIVKRLRGKYKITGVFLDDIDGAETLFSAKNITAFGLFEAITKLPAIRKGLKTIENYLKSGKPDAVLLIDFPGFNLKVAEIAKSQGIKVLYFISPKFWAWNYKRGEKIVKFVNRMFVIFPFEVELYRKLGFDATYVGNPLVEMVKPSKGEREFLETLRLKNNPILLMPGSRPSEIRYLLKPLLLTAKEIKKQFPYIEFVLPVAESLSFESIKNLTQNVFNNVKLVKGEEAYNCMFYSQFGIIASGTASLEAAIAGLPHIVVYKLHPLTFMVAKRVVKLPFISLPNIIAGEKVVREVLQKDVNPANLTEIFTSNFKQKEKIKEKLKMKVKPKLKGNAIENLCLEIEKELK